MNKPEQSPPVEAASQRMSRRSLLVGGGVGLLAGAAGARWLWTHNECFQSATTAILKAEAYDARLESILREGLGELGIDRRWCQGKSVLLKPNLVEPRITAPQINTNPQLVRAAVEVFRRWDAREVFVAEGPGHTRDMQWVLEQSGLEAVLREADIEFVDLNHDDIFATKNRLGLTGLGDLYLPKSIQRADRIVSMAKMKTHHWAGATLSMKNLFGMMPGICYGWPKNVLHQVGIPNSILDITATIRPQLAIVDGIVGMEGDGPIMGTAKRANVLVVGTNLPAVDATAARLMDLDPWRIPYLRGASGRLGPIGKNRIKQRGEPIRGLVQHFELIDDPRMKALRG
ncbi:MAG: DUF362 domain-containing protein [Pirellulales bacterium]|nr:DUF362 domain-containing protein [Pirellulales bacterium]